MLGGLLWTRLVSDTYHSANITLAIAYTLQVRLGSTVYLCDQEEEEIGLG